MKENVLNDNLDVYLNTHLNAAVISNCREI